MPSVPRRAFLQGTICAGVVGVAAATDLLTPIQLLAAWPENAFQAGPYKNALQIIAGTSALPDGQIDIFAPEIADNGAMVAVTVESHMPDVTEIALFIVKNNRPLASQFLLGPLAIPLVSVRVKMAETSDVVVAVKSGGTWYGASREVKVTLGGCGG